MMFNDMVESVMEENEEVLDIGGILCLLRLGLRLKCARETLLCSVEKNVLNFWLLHKEITQANL